MNKRIVYTNDIGVVCVVIPAPEMFNQNSKTRDLIKADLKNEEEVLSYIAKSLVPNGVKYKIIDASEIPSRDFRDAWVLDNDRIDHDMEKCRNIWKEKIRSVRASILTKLDVEYQKADEISDIAAKKEIARKKQILRDVTSMPEIKEAKTPEELKAVWPEVLNEI